MPIGLKRFCTPLGILIGCCCKILGILNEKMATGVFDPMCEILQQTTILDIILFQISITNNDKIRDTDNILFISGFCN